jgi:hypothetical protein
MFVLLWAVAHIAKEVKTNQAAMNAAGFERC